MTMDFAAVRHIAIPEGIVIQIAKDAQPFWRGLPVGYTAVEYIQGNNTAYINEHTYIVGVQHLCNDNMTNERFYEFLLAAFKNTEAVMASDASIYVFHADTEGLNFRRAFADAGFNLSGCCIWKKQSLVLGRSPYQWQHEPVLFGWKKNGKHQWYTGRKETTIWEFDKPKKNGDHPTMKPIPLLVYPIMNAWTDYYSCHATISNETNSEDEVAGVTVDNTNTDFTVRWCSLSSAITATEYRVVMDGEIFDILSVDHMNFKRKSIKLRCRKARR